MKIMFNFVNKCLDTQRFETCTMFENKFVYFKNVTINQIFIWISANINKLNNCIVNPLSVLFIYYHNLNPVLQIIKCTQSTFLDKYVGVHDGTMDWLV